MLKVKMKVFFLLGVIAAETQPHYGIYVLLQKYIFYDLLDEVNNNFLSKLNFAHWSII